MHQRAWEVYHAAQQLIRGERDYLRFCEAPEFSQVDGVHLESSRAKWTAMALEEGAQHYYYFDRAITPLILASAPGVSLEGLIPHPELFISPLGWFYSPDVPFGVTNVARYDMKTRTRRYDPLPVHGLVWVINDARLLLATIVHVEEDEQGIETRRPLASYGLAGYNRARPILDPHDVIGAGAPRSDERKQAYVAECNTFMRVFLAAHAWIRQEIVRVEPSQAPRAERRRAEREQHAVPPAVNVVVLRRVTARDDAPPRAAGESIVAWEHRWLVSGHWRNQFYPSTGKHAPTWIRPYIKGPDDKPMKAPSPRIFTVQR